MYGEEARCQFWWLGSCSVNNKDCFLLVLCSVRKFCVLEIIFTWHKSAVKHYFWSSIPPHSRPWILLSVLNSFRSSEWAILETECKLKSLLWNYVGQRGRTTPFTGWSWGPILQMNGTTLWLPTSRFQMKMPSLTPHITAVRKEVLAFRVILEQYWCFYNIIDTFCIFSKGTFHQKVYNQCSDLCKFTYWVVSVLHHSLFFVFVCHPVPC